VVWLLRCSVFRETPMASVIYFKKLNGYEGMKRGEGAKREIP